MAIINFTFAHDQIPEGAISVRGVHGNAGYKRFVGNAGDHWDDDNFIEFQGPDVYWTWLTHVGLCLENRERNGYNDSDFYMIVWNPEKQAPESIEFASTRGWSYPAYGSSADATPEVRAAYDAWCAKKDAERHHEARVAKVQAKLAARATNREIAHRYNVSYGRVLQAKAALRNDWERVAHLMVAKLRSGFKIRLREQVAAWMADPNPKYRTPLSAKQLAWV